MFAVLTSKGQLTLPKALRDQLSLTTGSRLDFTVNEKGWLLARPVNTTALGLAGMLRRAGQVPVSAEDMTLAVTQTAVALNVGERAAGKSTREGKAKAVGKTTTPKTSKARA